MQFSNSICKGFANLSAQITRLDGWNGTVAYFHCLFDVICKMGDTANFFVVNKEYLCSFSGKVPY